MSTRRDSKVGGFALGLLVLCAVVFGVGFLMPSSGSAAPGYHPMAAPAAPVRLVIPALKIRAPIQPIEVNDRRCSTRRATRVTSAGGRAAPAPGATQGQTVLTGHTVHTGGGVMDHLGQLRKGQLVKVVTRKGPMVYRTTKVVTWSKDRARQAVGRAVRPGARATSASC